MAGPLSPRWVKSIFSRKCSLAGGGDDFGGNAGEIASSACGRAG